MESEKVLEKKLREQVKKLGGWAVKFWAVNLSGFPDRMVFTPNGKISFVELKSEGKKPSPIQKIIIKKLRSMNFDVFVIDTTEKLNDYLNYLKQ